jgi:hypothetical protein
MTVSSFRLTDKELVVLRRGLNRLFRLQNGFGAVVDDDFQILVQIRNDIEEYFDEMERRASDQMVIEDNIELGME